MEDSDDNLSFVSASDSDIETESLIKNFAVSSPSAETGRASSPACSLISRSSFRRTAPKRPAPQPPTKEAASSDVSSASEDVSPSPEPMTTFVQEFNKIIEKGPNEIEALQKSKMISGLASHPIHLLPSEDTQAMPSADSNPHGGFVRGRTPGRNLANLQIKLIDDVLEPLSQSLPLSPTFTSSSSLSHSYQPQGSPPHPTLSTIYSDLPSSPQSPNSSPFYVASVHTGGLLTFPVHSSPLDSTLSGSTQYVPVAPLNYIPQISSQCPALFGSPLTSGTGFSSPLMTERVVRNPLMHSASDPGVNQMLRSSLSLPAGPSLDRLSEAEEIDDDDYEEVFVRQESSSNRDVVPANAKKRRRRRSERYDSVGVPQLYEDLLVSQRFNLKVTFTNLTMVVVAVAFFMPNSASVLYNFFRLVFGTLFPAYYSYKAVRTKNVKEYVKWMMYWIVFAFFTCAETITDVFLSFWFPFYYEIKILVVLWLLSPATRGSSILYRKFVHPWLTKKEEEIDECIAKAKQQGYSTVVQLGTKGVNYATSVIMQTAIKGGGGIVSQLKRSYSASEIGEDTADHNRNVKVLSTKETLQSPSEEDDVSVSSGSYESEPRHRAESESSSSRPRGHSTGRAVRTGKTRSADVSEVYFHDTTETVTQRRSPRTHDAGRTADGGSHQNVTRRSRSGDIAYATLPRATTKRAGVKKRQA